MRNIQVLKDNGVDLDSALELLGDLSFYDETLEQFIEENKTRLPNIAKYRKEGNMSDYAILVHSLKSDAKYLGFTKLAEIALTHEMASKANDINKVNEQYNDLVNTYNTYARIAFKYLETDDGSNNNQEPQATNNLEGAKKKIIVADDSLIISSIVEKAFDGLYDVLIAVNGEKAINYTKEYNSDTIAALILDLNMPKVDGFAVLEYFKENDLFKKIPVCIITGDVDKSRIDKAFTYDIVDMIQKPFTVDSVRNVINRII